MCRNDEKAETSRLPTSVICQRPEKQEGKGSREEGGSGVNKSSNFSISIRRGWGRALKLERLRIPRQQKDRCMQQYIRRYKTVCQRVRGRYDRVSTRVKISPRRREQSWRDYSFVVFRDDPALAKRFLEDGRNRGLKRLDASSVYPSASE